MDNFEEGTYDFNEHQKLDEPLRKNAKCLENTTTDVIFNFIGSLDDSHLMAASRSIKAVIKERKEGSKFEMLVCYFMKAQINGVSVEHIKSDATMNIDHTP